MASLHPGVKLRPVVTVHLACSQPLHLPITHPLVFQDSWYVKWQLDHSLVLKRRSHLSPIFHADSAWQIEKLGSTAAAQSRSLMQASTLFSSSSLSLVQQQGLWPSPRRQVSTPARFFPRAPLDTCCAVVGASTPSFAKWIFAIVCYVATALQVLGIIAVAQVSSMWLEYNVSC